MSRTYKKKEVHWSSPRELQSKRPKEALRHQIDEDLEELKRIRSPLYAWEVDREANQRGKA